MQNTATKKLITSLQASRERGVCMEVLAGADIIVGGSRPWDVGRSRGSGWMFSGARLPIPRLLDRVLDLLPNGR